MSPTDRPGEASRVTTGGQMRAARAGRNQEQVDVRALRVALLCPYSLSVFGGVQAQVLGLAAELRRRGVDARVIAPSDGPPPEPGITSIGSTMRFPSNGSIAPIASSKAIAARTLEALRVFAPDVLHLHEPLSPGANHTALVGTDIPAVGTFHAAHPGRNAWYEALSVPLRAMVSRLAVRTAVSEEAQRNVEAAFGESCEILPNGVAVEAFAAALPWPATRPGDHVRGSSRTAEGPRGAARGVLRSGARRGPLGRGRGSADRGVAAAPGARRRVARHRDRRREGTPAPRGDRRVLPVRGGRVVRRGAPRGDGRGRGGGRLQPHRLRHGRTCRARRRCSSSPTTPAPCGGPSAACSTTPGSGGGSPRPASPDAEGFSFGHLAERLIPIYTTIARNRGMQPVGRRVARQGGT